MVTYQVKDRLKQYLSSIKKSIYQLEKDCGFSRSYFVNAKFNVPTEKIDIILRQLPDLNREWLLTGEGEMTNGLPISEIENTMTPSEREEAAAFRRQAMARVEGVIINDLAPSVERYEKQNHIIPGNFRRAVKRGDDRIVKGWIDAVYRESNMEYSYDWLTTGEGMPYRTRQPFYPVIEETAIHERFNMDNFRARPLDKEWLNSYYSKETPVGITYTYNDVDFAMQTDNPIGQLFKKGRKQVLCKIVDPQNDNIISNSHYVVCDRKTGVRIVQVRQEKNGLVLSDENSEEQVSLWDLSKFSVFAMVIGVILDLR